MLRKWVQRVGNLGFGDRFSDRDYHLFGDLHRLRRLRERERDGACQATWAWALEVEGDERSGAGDRAGSFCG